MNEKAEGSKLKPENLIGKMPLQISRCTGGCSPGCKGTYSISFPTAIFDDDMGGTIVVGNLASREEADEILKYLYWPPVDVFNSKWVGPRNELLGSYIRCLAILISHYTRSLLYARERMAVLNSKEPEWHSDDDEKGDPISKNREQISVIREPGSEIRDEGCRMTDEGSMVP